MHSTRAMPPLTPNPITSCACVQDVSICSRFEAAASNLPEALLPPAAPTLADLRCETTNNSQPCVHHARSALGTQPLKVFVHTWNPS